MGVYLHSITQAQGRKKVCHCHQPFGHWCLQGYGGKGRARQAGSGALTPISSRVSVIGETDPAGVWLSLTPGALPPPRPTGCPPKSLLLMQRIFGLVKRLPRISQQRLGKGSVFLHFRGMALAQSRVPSSGGIHHHLSAALIVRAGAGVCGCF